MTSFALVVPAFAGIMLVFAIYQMVRLIGELTAEAREAEGPQSRVFAYGFVSFLVVLILLCGFGLFKVVEAVLTW